LIPTSRLDTGFWAAPRIARPIGVKRKNRKTSSRTHSVTPIMPISCAERYELAYQALDGKGLGKLLIV
jgi:hypothetical protein